jgi:hypothetical protein
VNKNSPLLECVNRNYAEASLYWIKILSSKIKNLNTFIPFPFILDYKQNRNGKQPLLCQKQRAIVQEDFL